VGTGVESTVLDIIDALAPHADGPFEAQHEPERLGEIRHIALDTSRARDELGWEPRTNLSDGLRVTLESLQ
jgi:UDP-glucose 4-epimerase